MVFSQFSFLVPGEAVPLVDAGGVGGGEVEVVGVEHEVECEDGHSSMVNDYIFYIISTYLI